MLIFHKTRCSHIKIFNFFMKTPCCYAHIWSKKHQFGQNYTILWVKKINRSDFFFRLFTKKLLFSCPYLKKKVNSVKTQCFQAHILSKKLPYYQKHSALISFASNFNEKHLLSCPYLVINA